MVLRTAVETYMDDSNLEKILEAVREAVNHAAPVMNTDGPSQEGYFAMLTPRTALSDKEAEYAVLDWRSYKLARVGCARA